MYESRRLGAPISREKLTSSESPTARSSSLSLATSHPEDVDPNETEEIMNTDRTETTDRDDSDVEVEIVGDTKKVYVYSPVFTKEDEELYRFVSSRVQDVPEDNNEDDDGSSSTISSTDSLEGASKPTSQDKSEKQATKPHSKSGNKKQEELRDSLDNNWADPPRLESVTSTVPPLELRDVETPSKPREKKADSHRKKTQKKKSSVSDDTPIAKTDNPDESTPSATFIGQPGIPPGIPATFLTPGAFPGAGPTGGIVYIAAPGSFGGAGGVPIPFPFIFPNQMMPTGATITEVHQSSDSDETLTEQPNKEKHKHHHKHKKETRDIGEMTTPDNAASSLPHSSHQNTMSSSTLQGSATVPSGSSRDLYNEDDYYYEQNKKYGTVESPAVTGQPWSGRGIQDEYGDEYYYDKTESNRSNNGQANQSKIAGKPFGSDSSTSFQHRKVPANFPVAPSKQPQQPLPFRRNDVDYVEHNKRTYGRLKGSSYGQMLDRRNEDKSVTNMIEEERMRIRMKVEEKAAEMRRLKLGGKGLISGQGYPDRPQEYDESFLYDTPSTENYDGRYPSNNTDYYDEQYYPPESSAEYGWRANVQKLAYAQEKKAALRRANDSALAKSSSAPTKGTSAFGPPRPPIPPSGSSKPQPFAGSNQLTVVTEEAGPNRYRVNHELQLQAFSQEAPNRGVNRAIGSLQQQQQLELQQIQLQRMANLQQQFEQQQQQFQVQQQRMAMYDDYMASQQQGVYQQAGNYPQQDLTYRLPYNNTRLSNSFSHQNLTQLDYGPGELGGNYNRNPVGQAADWPLMSSRQTQQFYGNQFSDQMNQYSPLPPISKDNALQPSPRQRVNEEVTTDRTKNKIRAQSDYTYLKDRQNMYLQQQPDSYVTNFMNQMAKVNHVTSYKPYTLRDYRQMKKEIQLLSKVGGLGPDLESEHVRVKAERQTRRLKYAQFVEEVNKHALEQTREQGSPRFAQPPTEESVRRQKLLEYARNIPKPKVKRAKPEEAKPSGKPDRRLNRKPVAQDQKPRKANVHKEDPDDGFLTFVRTEQGKSDRERGNVFNDDQDDGFLTFARADQGGSSADQAAIEEMRRRHEQDKQLAYNNGGTNSGRRSNRDTDSKQVRFVGSGVGNTPKA